MENKNNWKKCPNCGGYIPNAWEMHRKCGWNVVEKLDESPQETEVKDSKLASICLAYAKDLVCAGKADIKNIEKLHARLMAVLK